MYSIFTCTGPSSKLGSKSIVGEDQNIDADVFIDFDCTSLINLNFIPVKSPKPKPMAAVISAVLTSKFAAIDPHITLPAAKPP